MEQFKAQLEDFGQGQTFDVFIARYHLDYQHSAKYVEKKTIGNSLNAQEVLTMGAQLKNLNEENFNIYIRPTNYGESNLIVLDDYYSSVELTQQNLGIELGLVKEDFSLAFSILTSVDITNKNKDKNSKKYNYQLGIEFNPKIHTQQKSFLLTFLCEQLGCDSNHAKISKYLRASGFYNKKYWPLKNQLDKPEQKNTFIEYKAHNKLFKPHWVINPKKIELESPPEHSGLLSQLRSKFKM